MVFMPMAMRALLDDVEHLADAVVHLADEEAAAGGVPSP
jgi:hypothetical protein